MEGVRSTLLSVDVYEHGRPFLGGHKRELCWRIFGFGDFLHASSMRKMCNKTGDLIKDLKGLLTSLLIEVL
jgi:hypothetical protein